MSDCAWTSKLVKSTVGNPQASPFEIQMQVTGLFESVTQLSCAVGSTSVSRESHLPKHNAMTRPFDLGAEQSTAVQKLAAVKKSNRESRDQVAEVIDCRATTL